MALLGRDRCAQLPAGCSAPAAWLPTDAAKAGAGVLLAGSPRRSGCPGRCPPAGRWPVSSAPPARCPCGPSMSGLACAMARPSAVWVSAAFRSFASRPPAICWTRKKPRTATTTTEITSVVATTRSCSDRCQRRRSRPTTARARRRGPGTRRTAAEACAQPRPPRQQAPPSTAVRPGRRSAQASPRAAGSAPREPSRRKAPGSAARRLGPAGRPLPVPSARRPPRQAGTTAPGARSPALACASPRGAVLGAPSSPFFAAVLLLARARRRPVSQAGPALYPTPRTVTTISGCSGSFSILARSRCTCTLTSRVSAACR